MPPLHPLGETVHSILIVGQEPSSSIIAQRVIEHGYSALSAHSAREGVERAVETECELILVDSRTRDLSVTEFIDVVRERRPGQRIVVLDSSGCVEAAVAVMRRGAFDYLRMPADDNALSAQIEDLLRRPALRAARYSAPISKRADPFSRIIGNSSAMRSLLEIVQTVARTDSTVLISGETGTGKELIGRAVHDASLRAGGTFSAINAAAIPEALLESELFGHRRGAFTGAIANKKGLFESAEGGTVFLDEIGEMPAMMQAKLLRFLQTGEIQPVGAEATKRVDVRLVAATNRDLEEEVAAGRFREDLYYRLAVIPLALPALRERRSDIPLLAQHFVQKFASQARRPVTGLSAAAERRLLAHDWPGNVRELENAIERGVALSRSTLIQDSELTLRERPVAVATRDGIGSLEAVERTHILKTLDVVGWNRKRAAEILEISTTTLWRRLKEFGVDGPNGNARRI